MGSVINNNTVLITGAAGVLGSALSLKCAEAGMTVVMLDNRQDVLEANWDSIVGRGLPKPCIHPLDLATAGPEEYGELVGALESEFKGLDGLIHCAARFDGLRLLDQIPPAEWLLQIQVNLNAAWLLSSTCLPLLRNAQSSVLIFLLEDLARVENGYWGAYGVSKHGLKALASQFASECSSSRVRVMAINPGPMAGPLRAAAYHAEDPTKIPSAVNVADKIMELIAHNDGSNDIFRNLIQTNGG